MNENYLEFFGLSENPFKLTPDVKFYYFSKYHEIALEHLRYFYNSKDAFAVIIGEPGVGKTLTIRKFIDEIEDKVEIAYILFPNLSPEELFLAILEDLKIEIPPNSTKNKLFSVLRDFLIKKKEEGKQVIIIIDEAQNLPNLTLEELRIISNLETENEKLVKILLVGQPELYSKINSPNLKQLRQRITIMEEIYPLDFEETKNYVLFRIHKANGNIDIEEKAFKTLYKLSKGYPRLINQLMERALMAAFLDETKNVKEKHILRAVDSLNLKFEDNNKKKTYIILGALFTVVFISLLFLWSLNKNSLSKKFHFQQKTLQNKETLQLKNTTEEKFYIMYFFTSSNFGKVKKFKEELEKKLNKKLRILRVKNGKYYAVALLFKDKSVARKEIKILKNKLKIKDIFLTKKQYNPEIIE